MAPAVDQTGTGTPEPESRTLSVGGHLAKTSLWIVLPFFLHSKNINVETQPTRSNNVIIIENNIPGGLRTHSAVIPRLYVICVASNLGMDRGKCNEEYKPVAVGHNQVDFDIGGRC